MLATLIAQILASKTVFQTEQRALLASQFSCVPLLAQNVRSLRLIFLTVIYPIVPTKLGFKGVPSISKVSFSSAQKA